MGVHRVKQALNASSRMWKTLSLLFLAATIGWSHKAGDLLLVDEAVKLLQIDNVQSLEKNLLDVKAEKAEKEQEVEALKAELELAKNIHAAQMAEMKSSHAGELEKLRSTLQGEVGECKENILGNLKMVRDSQEVIQVQKKTIEDLKSVVSKESSLNAAYQQMRDADCDYLAPIITTISTQREEIENLKKAH